MEEKDYDLLSQLSRFEWLLHRLRLKNHLHFGPMGDPRRGQGRVLGILKMQPEISQRELSYLLDMRPQSLGELLSKLEKNGYITRTTSETDRRMQNIKLTPEGAAATESAEPELGADKLFECLSEEEQNNMRDYLDRLIKALEDQLGDDPYMHDPGSCPHKGGHFDERCREHHNRAGWDRAGDPRSEMIRSLHRHHMNHFDRCNSFREDRCDKSDRCSQEPFEQPQEKPEQE